MQSEIDSLRQRITELEAEDDFDKMIREAFEEDEARIEKERQNKTSSNVVTLAKANDYNDGGSNSCDDDSDPDSNSGDEVPDDSDDDGYNGCGGYNEYGDRDRGYYYHDGGYGRKTSPMMSPIISPVTA